MARPQRCQHCNTEFLDVSVRQTSRFCSRRCITQFLREHNRKHPETIERTCQFCKKRFQASHKKFRQGKALYCSPHCRAKMAARKPAEDRFWSRVDKTSSPHGCWLWTGKPSVYGYGTLSIHGHIYKAHRIAYLWHYGILPDNMMVCHKCPGGENRLCVNPAHLYLGSAQDNADDKARFRQENRRARKLTASDVRMIRHHYNSGMPRADIAQQYNVHRSTIGAIINKATWKEIPPHAPSQELLPIDLQSIVPVIVSKNRKRNRLQSQAVLDMRQQYAAGARIKDLSRAFHLSEKAVSRIIHGHTWKHLPL